VLENIRPVLHNLDPFLQYMGNYVNELQAFFANLTAATSAHQTNANVFETPHSNDRRQYRYLETMQVLSPESLSVYSKRIGTDRSNAYPLAGAYNSLPGGLSVFEGGNCANSAPSVTGPENEAVSGTLLELIQKFKVANKPETANEVAAPACNQQGPNPFNGQSTQYPHAVYGGKP